MEIGNLLFGNSRGSFSFSRDYEKSTGWNKLVNTIGFEDWYCYLGKYCADPKNPSESIERTNNLEASDSGGYLCIDNAGEKVFEISPYYWGECTCGAEGENAALEKKIQREIFTPEEIKIINSYYLDDCDDDCPASFNVDENFDLSLEELANKCTCGARKKEYELEKEKEKLAPKTKKYEEEYKKRMVMHSKKCLLIKHNFIFHEGKEDEFWVDWYKYPFRDSYCNKKLTKKEVEEIFDKCITATENDIKRLSHK